MDVNVTARGPVIAWIGDNEVAWLTSAMYDEGLYEHYVIQDAGYYILHKEDINARRSDR